MWIKCLMVRQPWADLIAAGFKPVETRTWKTNYRGPLLIAVSRHPKAPNSGLAICMVNLLDCRPMVKEDEEKACCEIYPRANSWLLGDVTDITPFEVQGRLGLFDVEIPDDCDALVEVDEQDELLFDERKCRVCGCTDNDCSGCIEKTGKPCHWLEYDLCSACESSVRQ